MHAGNSDTGGKTVHFSSPNQQTTLVPESTPPNSETTSSTACSAVVNDKYFLCNHLNWVDESHEFTHFLEQVHYFEDMSKCSENCQGVKGSVARHVAYWEKIGASSFVLDTMKNGYVIPFIEPPIQMCFKNNRSALGNEEFVSQTIFDLIKSGCVVQVPFQPFVVNPLSVATHKSGKKRLLDLSTLNRYVKRDKIKFEDWRVAVQYFDKNFHIDICPQQHTYLEFQWKEQFYSYTVLAFGITTGPYYFY
jgi:hypothetical protein